MPLAAAALVLLTAQAVPPMPSVARASNPHYAELPAASAWEALERGDAARAAALFRDALEQHPHDARLHFGAGYAAFALGNHDAAITALRKALEHDPRFVQAAALLGQVAYERGDLPLAIRSMERAVALAPRDRLRAEQLERWRREATIDGGGDKGVGLRLQIQFDGPAHDALAQRVTRVLQDAYWRVGRALNHYPSETLTVVLDTQRAFQDTTRAPKPAGRDYARLRLAAAGALRAPQILDRVLVHELVHAMVASLAPHGVPAWVHEGLAGALESPDQEWVGAALGGSKTRISLDQLVDGFHRFDGPTARIAYAESAVAGRLLIERLGTSLVLFLQMLGTSHTPAQALSILDVRPEEFEAEWRRRLR